MTIADLKIKLRETPRIVVPRHVDIERLGKIADLLRGGFSLYFKTQESKVFGAPVAWRPHWLAVLNFHAKSTFAEPMIASVGETAQEALDFLGDRIVKTIRIYEENLSPGARVIGAKVRRILAGEEP